MRVLGSCSAEETYNIAKDMGEAAKEGEVVTLTGDLGTGKTVFAKGFAAGLGVKELWLTHYSPSMNDPREYLHVAKGVFPDTVAAKDGRTKELKYEEAE